MTLGHWWRGAARKPLSTAERQAHLAALDALQVEADGRRAELQGDPQSIGGQRGKAIAAFVLDRVTEDEVVARAAIDDEATHPWGDKRLPRMTDAEIPDEFRGSLGGTWGEHAARWAMPRVLEECEQKRRLVDMALRLDRGWLALLQRLAAPYADHPAYRDEWHP